MAFRATDMKGLCAQQIIKIVSFSESFDSRFHNVGIIYIVDNEIYNGVKFTKNKKFNNLNAALVILLKPFRTNERTKKKVARFSTERLLIIPNSRQPSLFS